MGKVCSPVLLLGFFVSRLTLMSAQYCPEPTRPHTSRCDQYLRCDKLSTGDHVWTTVQCQQGLVYQQHMDTCVVPDSDWECDLSAENDRDRSEENVYGVDSGLDSESRASSDDGEDHPLFSSEPESSGDGGLETLSDESETESAPAQTSMAARQDVPQQPSTLSSQTSNDVTANQDKNATLTELQLSEQLKRFIEQQKTWIANNLKLRKYLSAAGAKKTEDHSNSSREVDKPEPPKTDLGPSPSQKHTGGLVSEDLIRNVLSISQQIISNQKESAALKSSIEQKPIVTPIYIPYPVGAISGPTARPPPTNTNVAASQPASASFNNLPHNNYFTVYDANNQFPANVSTTAVHQRPPVLYDAFGHRILPFQSFPPYVPAPSGYQVANSGYNPYYAGVQQPPGGRYPNIFSSPSGAPLNGPPDYYHGQYQPGPPPVAYDVGYAGSQQQIGYGPSHQRPAASFDRNELSDPSLSDENDALDSTENDDEEDDSPISAFSDEYNDEVAPPEETADEPTSHLKRKLFALDDERTLDYEEYKDRILPLLRANPGDTRITLLTCSLGSRQPNRTDCFRYYVCNPHNGAFQTFTCPTNTAFNKNTRLCDSASYKPCQMATVGPKRQVSLRRQKPQAHRKRTQEQPAEKELLRKAQKYVELIRRQALKVMVPPSTGSNSPQAVMGQPQARPVKVHRRKSSSLAAKRRVASTTTTTTTRAPVKVTRCRLEGRMPDPNDRINYYVCHRKSEKKFTKLKMACPPNLIYCAESQYCTLATNC